MSCIRLSWAPLRRSPAAAVVLVGTILGSALLPGVVSAAGRQVQAEQSVLVNESFTGANAQSGFTAVGPACLTGAPQAEPPTGAAGHPLGGCSATPVGPAPPRSAAPYGYLQLTSGGDERSAAVIHNGALPANEGLEVSFDQWQYGGRAARKAADGISFFLVDGAAQLTRPGASGVSLGYAQKRPDDDPGREFVPGVDHGYLGVGLEVLGDYFGDGEHRGDGCEQRSPAGTQSRAPAPGRNMVTVRGPGQDTTGYCFLTATTDNLTTTGPWPSTLPGELHGPTTAADLPAGTPPVEAQQVLEASRRTVTVRVGPAPDPTLTVLVDFHDGNGSRQVLETGAPQPVPATYKFGFAASTGLFADVHLIRTLSARSLRPLPQLNLVKQISRAEILPDELVPGAKVPYEFVVTNAGDTEITDASVSDPAAGPVTCPESTLAVGRTMTCTAEYTITEADAVRGYLDSTAQASGNSDGQKAASPPSEVKLPLGGPIGLSLDKQVNDSRAHEAGDQVAHTFVVSNVTDGPLAGLGIVDDRLKDISCESKDLTARGTPADSTTCTGTYVVTEEDATGGSVVATAVATAAGGTVKSPPDQATIRIHSPTPPPPPTPPPTPTPTPTPTHPWPTHSPKPTHHAWPGGPHAGPPPGGGHLAVSGTGTDPMLLATAGAALAAGLLVTFGLRSGRLRRLRRTSANRRP
ncbi:hypothetical protein [Streptomyces sp. NPDC005181]|uniref:DUF7507 domain-containing protein n=1 Tax=Streptomyces sp. NPDC005181 TaxID=3156869 RepID=UPI0033A77381